MKRVFVVLFFIVSVSLGSGTTMVGGGRVIFHGERNYRNLAIAKADKHGISRSLFLGVIAQESRFYRYATSPSGAIGLTQLMPSTALYACPDLFSNKWQAYDPEKNLECGARYLSWQLAAFSSERAALSGYNAGPGRTRRNGGNPPTEQARKYIVKVQMYSALYRYLDK